MNTERKLEKEFAAVAENLGNTEVSKDRVDASFGGLIDSFLTPVAEIAKRKDEVSVEELNESLGTLAREVGIPMSIDLLSEIAKKKGVDSITLKTWVGPQAVGKGAISTSMKWTRTLVDDVAGRDVFLDQLSKDYELDESQRQDVEVSLQRLPKELDSTLRSIFQVTADEQFDTISTGTGGIFHPKGVNPPNPRYVPYIKQYDVTGPIVKEGIMVHKDWTNFLVTLEIARSVAYGKDKIEMDVWPRTVEQAEYLHEELAPQLAERGLSLEHQLIHIEPLDKETVEVIQENRDEAEKAYGYFGKVLGSLARDPESFGLDLDDLDILASLGIDPSAEPTEEIKTSIKKEGYKKMRRSAERIKGGVKTKVESEEGFNQVGGRIVSGLAESVQLSLLRVSNRVRSQGRADDLNMTGLLRRFSIYYQETAPVALRYGESIIHNGVTFGEGEEPHEGYILGFESAIASLATSINSDYDLANPNYQAFLDLATKLYLIRTSK